MSTKLYVGGLPYSTTESELNSFLPSMALSNLLALLRINSRANREGVVLSKCRPTEEPQAGDHGLTDQFTK